MPRWAKTRSGRSSIWVTTQGDNKVYYYHSVFPIDTNNGYGIKGSVPEGDYTSTPTWVGPNGGDDALSGGAKRISVDANNIPWVVGGVDNALYKYIGSLFRYILLRP